jgi:hypothetical protein
MLLAEDYLFLRRIIKPFRRRLEELRVGGVGRADWRDLWDGWDEWE